MVAQPQPMRRNPDSCGAGHPGQTESLNTPHLVAGVMTTL